MTDPKQPRGLRPTRLVALSDGVFAIALTVLVLELAVPAGSEDHLRRAILDQWPAYLAYLVSFSTIGAVWLAHNAITEFLERANTVFVRLNLLLLLVVSFLPFPTHLLADYIGEPRPERVAATFYGLTLLLNRVLVSVLWSYARRRRLVAPDASDDEVRLLTQRLRPSLVGYVVLLVLGLFVPLAAVVGYLALAAYLIVPIHHRTRRAT